MPTQPKPEPTLPSVPSNTTEDSSAPPPATEASGERSRFSQWLASFGLGELQNPLLTRAKPPLPRPHP